MLFDARCQFLSCKSGVSKSGKGWKKICLVTENAEPFTIFTSADLPCDNLAPFSAVDVKFNISPDYDTTLYRLSIVSITPEIS